MMICDTRLCTGCFACRSICPHDAITVATDANAKTIPSIDAEKCVECGACAKACPVNHKPEFHSPLKVYAAWSKTDEDVKKSSSGGIAAVLSREVIRHGGVVYGCASQNGEVKHIRVDTEEGISSLRGSKYVQSDTGTIFRSVKEDLLADREVLFIGVPCQVAGLKAFLHKPYDKLLTVDLICHGTPPFQYLKEYVNDMVECEWDEVSFRGKKDFYFTVCRENKVLYSVPQENDFYFKAFLLNLCYRDNCYVCPYAKTERCADITIGDFWGIDRETLKSPYNGRISLALVNTEKGNALWGRCMDAVVCEERAIEEAANPVQGNLLHPSSVHPDREKFLGAYQKYGFEKAVKKTKIGKAVKRKRMKARLKKLPFVKPIIKLKKKIFH